MKSNRRRTVALALSSSIGLAATSAFADLSSFPGAEGFGNQTSGGRATGSIYVVTNLNDSGAGSFRDAVSQSNRIIVFDVSGYVNMVKGSAIQAKSNLTILGQTAPGQGISTMGAEMSFTNSNNDILQYFHVREGSIDPNFKDSINIGNTTNMMLDHMSIEFAQYDNVDDVYSVTGGQGVYQNVATTYQNSIIADPIPGQQFNIHQEGSNVTYLNNIWANAHNRNPLAKGSTQFVNNVVYNYQGGYTTGDSTGNYNYDIINNYFIAGPSTSSPNDAFYQLGSNQHSYASGNLLDSNKDGTLSGSTVTPGGGTPLTSEYYASTQFLPTLSATNAVAFDEAHAGDVFNSNGTLTRDSVDAQVVSQVASNGTQGSILNSETDTGLPNGGFGNLGNATLVGNTNYLDTVPLTWLTAHGLSTTSATDLTYKNALGYDMIEQYAQEVGDQYSSMVVMAGDYNTLTYPSSSPPIYTHLLVRGTGTNNGALTISSTDTAAAAFTVSVGGNGPAAGETLTVNGGYLTVQDTIYLGDQNNGTLNLSNGTVLASNLQLGNTAYNANGTPTNYTGTFNFTGGLLQIDEIVKGVGTANNWTGGGVWNWSGGTIQAFSGFYDNANVTLSGAGATFNMTGPDSVAYTGTFAGVISGSAGVTKIGGGTLILSANNTYSGNTTITGGALKAAANNAFSNTTIFANSVNGLQLANGVTISNKITDNTGANEFEDVPDANAFATIAGNITGIGSQFRLGISGANATLNLTGASTCTNLTLITRGNILFSANGSLVNTNQAISIGRGGNTSTVSLTVQDNALVQGVGINFGGLGGSSDSLTSNVTLTGNGTISAGTSDINFNNNDDGGSVNLFLNGGTLKAGNFLITGAARANTTLNFNGGTILATANDGSAPFFPALGAAPANVAKILTGGLKVNDGGFNITIAQSLASGIGGDGGLTKSGSGTLNLTAANTYTGTTTVSTGTLNLNFAPLLTASNILLSTSTASISAGATLAVSGASTSSASQTLGDLNFGTGQSQFTLSTPSSNLTVTLTNITRNAGSGALLTVPANTEVDTPLGTASSVLVVNNTALGLINGDWTAKDPTNTFIVPGGSLPGFYTPNPLDGGNSSVALAGNIDMVNATGSDLANETRISANTFIGVVQFNTPGNFSITVKSGAFLSTQGVLVTPNAGSGNFNIDELRSNGAGDLTVWQNDPNASLTFGFVGNNGNGATSLNKNGPGTLVITGGGSYTGQSYLNGGITSINNDSGLGDPATAAAVNLNGGTLQADGTFALSNGAPGTNDRPIVVASLNGSIDVTPGNTLTVAGVVSGTGSLTKTNTGTLILAGANTLSGNISLNAGGLYINTTNGSGNIIVNAGTTLGGVGTLSGNILLPNAPHTINPGNAGNGTVGGTLTIPNLATNANTTLAFDLVSPGNHAPLLAVTGNLTLSGSTIAISSQTSTGAASLGYYRAIGYAGSLPNVSTLILPPVANNIAYTLDTTQDPGFIDIHRGFIGDATDDGTVSLDDLDTVLNNLGTTTSSWTKGNFDGAPTIDFNDLSDVLNQLGVSIPAGANLITFAESLTGTTAAPEPASLSLFGATLGALLLRRKRR